MSAENPVDGCQQVGGPDRLGLEVIHAGDEAALAILFPRARRQGNDWQVSPRGPLPLPNRLNDLEAVQLRHVFVFTFCVFLFPEVPTWKSKSLRPSRSTSTDCSLPASRRGPLLG